MRFNTVASRIGQVAHHVKTAALNVNATMMLARAVHNEVSELLPSNVSKNVDRGLTSYESVRDMARRVRP